MPLIGLNNFAQQQQQQQQQQQGLHQFTHPDVSRFGTSKTGKIHRARFRQELTSDDYDFEELGSSEFGSSDTRFSGTNSSNLIRQQQQIYQQQQQQPPRSSSTPTVRQTSKSATATTTTPATTATMSSRNEFGANEDSDEFDENDLNEDDFVDE